MTSVWPIKSQIRVEQGKGAKDRYTLLSTRLLAELRLYLKAYRPQSYLFLAARNANEPMNAKAAQRVFYAAKNRAGQRLRYPWVAPCFCHAFTRVWHGSAHDPAAHGSWSSEHHHAVFPPRAEASSEHTFATGVDRTAHRDELASTAPRGTLGFRWSVPTSLVRMAGPTASTIA
jgi:hypothetical protein